MAKLSTTALTVILFIICASTTTTTKTSVMVSATPSGYGGAVPVTRISELQQPAVTLQPLDKSSAQLFNTFIVNSTNATRATATDARMLWTGASAIWALGPNLNMRLWTAGALATDKIIDAALAAHGVVFALLSGSSRLWYWSAPEDPLSSPPHALSTVAFAAPVALAVQSAFGTSPNATTAATYRLFIFDRSSTAVYTFLVSTLSSGNGNRVFALSGANPYPLFYAPTATASLATTHVELVAHARTPGTSSSSSSSSTTTNGTDWMAADASWVLAFHYTASSDGQGITYLYSTTTGASLLGTPLYNIGTSARTPPLDNNSSQSYPLVWASWSRVGAGTLPIYFHSNVSTQLAGRPVAASACTAAYSTNALVSGPFESMRCADWPSSSGSVTFPFPALAIVPRVVATAPSTSSSSSYLSSYILYAANTEAGVLRSLCPGQTSPGPLSWGACGCGRPTERVAPDGSACVTCTTGSTVSKDALDSALLVNQLYATNNGFANAEDAANTWSLSSTSCATCWNATLESSAAACVACTAGSILAPATPADATLRPEGARSCTLCAAGTYSAANGSTICSACATGLYSSASGASMCTTCVAGSYSTDASRCDLCMPGSFSTVDRQRSCVTCDVGYAAPDYGSTTCAACGAGTFAASNGTVCAPCPLGQYSEASKNSKCANCPGGKTTQALGAASISACQSCPAGSYTSGGNGGSCIACELGYFAPNASATQCAACPAGRASGSTPGATQCTACMAGTYSMDEATTVCVPCAAGSVSNRTGSTACTSCQPGTFADNSNGGGGVDTSLVVCLPCAAGHVAPTGGASSCSACPAGSTSDATRTVCVPCPQGLFASTPGSSDCVPCPAGWSLGGYGLTSCTACQPGRYSGSASSLTCTSCEPGRFASHANATVCTDCVAGSFAASAGASLCDVCNVGFYAPVGGATTCDSCPPGYAPNSTLIVGNGNGGGVGAITIKCQVCSSGTFSQGGPSANCSSCPIGRFAESPGASSCTACAPGRFTNKTNVQFCEECPPGTFASANGSTTCTRCTAGSYSSTFGSAYCALCLVASFSGEGASDCTTCVNGAWCPVGAATPLDTGRAELFLDFWPLDTPDPLGDQLRSTANTSSSSSASSSASSLLWMSASNTNNWAAERATWASSLQNAATGGGGSADALRSEEESRAARMGPALAAALGTFAGVCVALAIAYACVRRNADVKDLFSALDCCYDRDHYVPKDLPVIRRQRAIGGLGACVAGIATICFAGYRLFRWDAAALYTRAMTPQAAPFSPSGLVELQVRLLHLAPASLCTSDAFAALSAQGSIGGGEAVANAIAFDVAADASGYGCELKWSCQDCTLLSEPWTLRFATADPTARVSAVAWKFSAPGFTESQDRIAAETASLSGELWPSSPIASDTTSSSSPQFDPSAYVFRLPDDSSSVTSAGDNGDAVGAAVLATAVVANKAATLQRVGWMPGRIYTRGGAVTNSTSVIEGLGQGFAFELRLTPADGAYRVDVSFDDWTLVLAQILTFGLSFYAVPKYGIKFVERLTYESFCCGKCNALSPGKAAKMRAKWGRDATSGSALALSTGQSVSVVALTAPSSSSSSATTTTTRLVNIAVVPSSSSSEPSSSRSSSTGSGNNGGRDSSSPPSTPEPILLESPPETPTTSHVPSSQQRLTLSVSSSSHLNDSV